MNQNRRIFNIKNSPTITDIENKYDNRFDDPSYYYGCVVDGGNV